MVKVGLLGCGIMGRTHAEAYAALPTAELAAVADVRPGKAREVAALTGAAVYPNADAVIADPSIQVIDICLPTVFHREFAVKAAKAGKHVFCEKPLARDLEGARAIVDACEGAGVRLSVGHVLRFSPAYTRARELVLGGQIGKPGVARASRGGGGFPTAWEDWYASFGASGGLILDMIIHDFDFLRWCFGEVERVYAKSTYGREFMRSEYALVTLRFKSGLIAHVEGTWFQAGEFAYAYEIAGDGGLVTFDSRRAVPIKTVFFDGSAAGGGTPRVAVPESPLAVSPYQLEVAHFIDCVENDRKPLVTGEDGYRALEIALAALKSVETGLPVSL